MTTPFDAHSEPRNPTLVEASTLQSWAHALGFNAVGISGIELAEDEAHLLDWLQAGCHGEMDYMQRHGTLRSRPQELLPGTLRVISVRMDYLPEGGPRPKRCWPILRSVTSRATRWVVTTTS